MSINQKASSLFLRLAIGVSYLWEVADRLGLLGPNGNAHVGWGDWKHFTAYAKQVMSFLPPASVNPLATLATIGEGGFGFLLIIGLFTRMAAIGSGLLSLCFAIAMAISFGIESPLGYSVFTLSAASFLLAGSAQFPWSVDSWMASRNINRKLTAHQTSRHNAEQPAANNPLTIKPADDYESTYSSSEIKQIKALVKLDYRI